MTELDCVKATKSDEPQLGNAYYQVHLQYGDALIGPDANPPFGYVDEAFAEFTAALSYKFGDPEALQGQHRVLLRRIDIAMKWNVPRKEFDSAYQQLAVIREIDPALPGVDDAEADANDAQADDLFTNGFLIEAETHYNKALQLRFDDAAATDGLRQLRLARLWNEAMANWDSNEARTVVALEDTLGLDGNYREGEAWEKLFAKRTGQAEHALSQGDIDGSDRAMDLAIATARTNPDRPERERQATLKKLSNQVDFYWDRDNQRALDALEGIMSIDPTYPDGDTPLRLYVKLLTKADGLLATSDCNDALPVLLRALAVRPGGEEAQQRIQACSLALTPTPAPAG